MTTGSPIFWPAGGPAAIRDGAISVLTDTGFFTNVYRQKTTPTKDDQLPCAAVWMVRDDTAPMGDANIGTPSFDHTYTLCIDVLMSADSDDALTATLDDLSLKTRTALLCSNNWRQTFEGIERCSIHPVYPKETNFIFVQASIEVVVTFRSAWPPYLPNNFDGIDGTIAPKEAEASTWSCPVCSGVVPIDTLGCPYCQSPRPPKPPDPPTFAVEINTTE